MVNDLIAHFQQGKTKFMGVASRMFNPFQFLSFVTLGLLISVMSSATDAIAPGIQPWVIENSAVNPIESINVVDSDDKYMTLSIKFQNNRLNKLNDYVAESKLYIAGHSSDVTYLVTVARRLDSTYELVTPRLLSAMSNTLIIDSKYYTDTSTTIMLNEASYKICFAIC